MLDPLARHDFMATVMTAVADDAVSVVLSSHVLAELERVADYLVLLSNGSVQVAGEVDDLLATHRLLSGPASEAERYAHEFDVVHASRAASQAHLLVRCKETSGLLPSGWEAHSVTLEELALAYLANPAPPRFPGPGRGQSTELLVVAELTVLTVLAGPEEGASLRPLPWRRMTWVIWRQHRAGLIGVVALLGALAVWLGIAGLQLHHAYAVARPPAVRPPRLPAAIWSSASTAWTTAC